MRGKKFPGKTRGNVATRWSWSLGCFRLSLGSWAVQTTKTCCYLHFFFYIAVVKFSYKSNFGEGFVLAHIEGAVYHDWEVKAMGVSDSGSHYPGSQRRRMQTSAQSPFSIYTVQNPSQGMIPLTVSRSSHFKIAPHRHHQRLFTQVILDSLSWQHQPLHLACAQHLSVPAQRGSRPLYTRALSCTVPWTMGLWHSDVSPMWRKENAQK